MEFAIIFPHGQRSSGGQVDRQSPRGKGRGRVVPKRTIKQPLFCPELRGNLEVRPNLGAIQNELPTDKATLKIALGLKIGLSQQKQMVIVVKMQPLTPQQKLQGRITDITKIHHSI